MNKECYHPVREKILNSERGYYAHSIFDWKCLICLKIIPFNERFNMGSPLWKQKIYI